MSDFYQQNEDGEFVKVEAPDVSGFRDQLEAALKEKKELEKQMKADREDAARFRATQRESAIKEAFSPYGDKAAKYWTALHPDEVPTPESLSAFVAEWEFEETGGTPAPVSTPVVAQPASSVTTFQPTVQSAGTPGPGQGRMSSMEWRQLHGRDPAAAEKAMKENRVDWNHPQTAEMLAQQGIGT